MTPETLHFGKAVVVIAVFAALFIGERLYSAASRPKGNGRLIRNGGLWLLVVLATPLIITPIAALGANHILWSREGLVAGGLIAIGILILDLIIMDVWTYWLHRAYHRIPLMWRLHEVHHRDQFLDTTSAVRFHLGEVALSAALRLIPITLLAIPLTHIIIFETLLLASALFHHSNLRLPARLEAALSRVIVTPSIHWVHHHAVRADTDSNYAAILSLWDRLFGSKSTYQRHPEMEIGAEGVEELTLLGLLLSPFKRS